MEKHLHEYHRMQLAWIHLEYVLHVVFFCKLGIELTMHIGTLLELLHHYFHEIKPAMNDGNGFLFLHLDALSHSTVVKTTNRLALFAMITATSLVNNRISRTLLFSRFFSAMSHNYNLFLLLHFSIQIQQIRISTADATHFHHFMTEYHLDCRFLVSACE